MKANEEEVPSSSMGVEFCVWASNRLAGMKE
eukprot:CAMPEP_0185259516 /NCGR_PEP_ID=MMETSP1359-20130426/8275_1 /TAXON_ID=552665 /ORGANISM="Bigelowiella longifila, Strain CCMP242" /LENGTH=30 /DNA_ID= /DNA_START= /DNA_END= /DNA_ORIENTATION=